MLSIDEISFMTTDKPSSNLASSNCKLSDVDFCRSIKQDILPADNLDSL